MSEWKETNATLCDSQKRILGNVVVFFECCSLTCFQQGLELLTPLIAELIGTCQAAVSTNYAQISDAQLYKVAHCFSSAFLSTEVLTAGTANHCATLPTHTE